MEQLKEVNNKIDSLSDVMIQCQLISNLALEQMKANARLKLAELRKEWRDKGLFRYKCKPILQK